jgi:hypothetical protein
VLDSEAELVCVCVCVCVPKQNKTVVVNFWDFAIGCLSPLVGAKDLYLVFLLALHELSRQKEIPHTALIKEIPMKNASSDVHATEACGARRRA